MLEKRDMVSRAEFIQGVDKLVKRLNSFFISGRASSCYNLVVDGHQVGYVLPAILDTLLREDEVNFKRLFVVQGKSIVLDPGLQTFEQKRNAMEEYLKELRKKNVFKDLNGWRDEHYNVQAKFGRTPLFSMERAAVSLFGIKAYGCHINGYVKDEAGVYKMWIARRSKTKQTYPGMLDNFTAGGLAAGLSVFECAVKELEEEANLTGDLTKRLRQVDAISYIYDSDDGVWAEGEFVFDLRLPLDFVPKNTDGEVECFYLMSIDEVKAAIISDDFKINSAAITLGFLMRKGLVNADELPNYYEILENLHAPGL